MSPMGSDELAAASLLWHSHFHPEAVEGCATCMGLIRSTEILEGVLSCDPLQTCGISHVALLGPIDPETAYLYLMLLDQMDEETL